MITNENDKLKLKNAKAIKRVVERINNLNGLKEELFIAEGHKIVKRMFVLSETIKEDPTMILKAINDNNLNLQIKYPGKESEHEINLIKFLFTQCYESLKKEGFLNEKIKLSQNKYLQFKKTI